MAVPLAEAKDPTTDQQQQVALVGVGAIVAATGLGWLFGGRAVRPLVELTQRVGRRDRDLATAASGVREADELAAAAGAMLQDVSDAQERTAAALDTARDFAAASAHELRTPLTAMRTDLEVLTTLDLSDEQRAEILADLARTQGRLEATLTALERLASGELSSEKDHVDLDLTELCDLAAEDAQRLRPDLTVTVDAPPGWSCAACRWDCGCRSTMRSAMPSGTAAHGTCRSVRTATTTAPSRSPSTTTAPASRTRRGPRCSSASGAAAAPPRAAPGSGWRSWRSRPVCTAARHTSRTAPSAARDWW